MGLKTRPTPFESMGIVDDDLVFGADQYQQLGASLRVARQRMARWIHELARRTWPITDWMRQFQPYGPASVTKGRHIALIGLLMLFIGWPDPTVMECLIFGFPAVGFSPRLGGCLQVAKVAFVYMFFVKFETGEFKIVYNLK